MRLLALSVAVLVAPASAQSLPDSPASPAPAAQSSAPPPAPGGGGGTPPVQVPPPESATVSFDPAAASTAEDETYTANAFLYTLVNSDGDDSNNPAASGTVAITSDNGDEIASFSASYDFSEGTLDGSTRAFSATPVDDIVFAGDREVEFTLAATTQNESSENTLTLTITEDEATPAPTLVINEILADPDTNDGDANGDGVVGTTDDEFLELVNVTVADLDISGYTVSDAVSLRHTFASGTVIESGAAIIVFGGGTPTGSFGGAAAVVASTGSLGLNNSSDTVTLANGAGGSIETVTYGGAAGDNQSIARDPDLTGAFVKHSSIASNPALFSPGVRNVDGQPFINGGIETVTQQPDDLAGYRLLSAPVLSYTVGDLAELNLVQGVAGQYPDGEDNVFTGYTPSTNDANDDTYVPATSTADVLEPGRGFFWYLFDNDVVPNPNSFGGGTSRSYDLAGRPFSATGPVIGSSISRTFPESANGFYMVGNPFGQTFETDNLSYNGTGTLATTLQAYDPTTGYQPITIAAGTYLATWQGVFAEVSGGTGTAQFDFAFDASDAGNPATFYGRQASTVLALALDGELDSGVEVHDRAAWVDLSAEGTSGWDRRDASKLIPPSADFALIAPVGTRDGSAYRQAVLSLGDALSGTVEVPLAFRSTGAGTFTITPTGLASLPSGTTATLVDLVGATSVALVEGQAVTFSAPAGDWAERFTLQLTAASTAGEDAPDGVDVGTVRPNPSAGSARLVVRTGGAEAMTATVYDALGRQVAVAFDGVATGETTVALPAGLAPGVYVVRVQGATFGESRQFVVTR